MKHSKTDYHGAEAVTLSNSAVELTVTTGVGPRITSLRALQAKNSQNLFLELSPKTRSREGYCFRGGHRLWHAPEHSVRTYQPDDDPVAVKPLKNGLALAQPVEPRTGLQKAIKIEFIGERTIKVTHALTNHGLWAVETAPWALTMFRKGGYGVVPLPPRGDHTKGDLLPTYSLVPWSYTDFSKPVWNLKSTFIGIDTAKATHPHKIGLSSYPGWSAFWFNGLAFVKSAEVVAGVSYPDIGCCFETYVNPDMMELETLAPMTKIEPGKSVLHVEHWTLIDGLPKPSTTAGFNTLSAAVAKWRATL